MEGRDSAGECERGLQHLFSSSSSSAAQLFLYIAHLQLKLSGQLNHQSLTIILL